MNQTAEYSIKLPLDLTLPVQPNGVGQGETRLIGWPTALYVLFAAPRAKFPDWEKNPAVRSNKLEFVRWSLSINPVSVRTIRGGIN